MDKLDDMLAFIKVVDARSFTAAADRLGLSKSVVSRRIAELEDRLGARLLNRTTRRLSPTEVGQAFYERCTRIVSDLDEAERAVGDLHGAPRGRLRLNAPVSFGRLHLAAAIVAFVERHPAIEIDIELNDRYVDLLEDGYDLAVRIGRLRDSSLVARKLAPCRRVMVASPAYLERFGAPQIPEDLARHNCLLYTNAP
ncbi:LysR family transcriptional regulator, partial [bacterium]|nr:LysR family transcriptional regulator [bacterium]